MNPTVVRTLGGSLSVDLLRGQAVVVVGVGGEQATLAPGQAEASLLRAHGVRKTPRYRVSLEQLSSDFLSAEAWAKARQDGVRRIHERWPDLSTDQAGKVFLGTPFVGMTEDQATEAVGRLVLAREPVPGESGTVAWKVGHRPRSAELRVYTEARERGARAGTFEEFLATRTRAILTLHDGVVIAIDPPAGQTPGLNWP